MSAIGPGTPASQRANGYCQRCGAELAPGIRYCASCGEPVASSAQAWDERQGGWTRPEAFPPVSGMASSVPAWLVSDWPLIGLSVIILLGILFGVSAAYGGVLTVLAVGPKAFLAGIRVGGYLAFSAFGVETAATNGAIPGAAIGTQFLPLPWLAVPIAATWVALHFAFSRLSRDRTTLVSFAIKLAVAFGIAMAILAAVLSVGHPEEDSGSFVGKVSAGEAWFFGTLLVAVAGLVIAQIRGTRVLADNVLQRARPIATIALDGVRAFAIMAIGLGGLAMVAAIIVVDSGSDRLGALFGTLFGGLTAGVVAASYAMGAAIDLGVGHTSLFHFGFPPSSDAGAAPVPFFLLLAVAPAVVAWMVWRRLERERPSTEQDVMRTGFIIAISFAVVAFVLALLSQVALGAVGFKEDDFVGTGALIARPSVTGVLGLGLLWGLVGGLGAAFYWATQHRVRWNAPQQAAWLQDHEYSAAGNPPPRQAAAPAQRGAPAAFCSNCGTPMVPGAQFCAACGTAAT